LYFSRATGNKRIRRKNMGDRRRSATSYLLCVRT
jgi:hypothetical protein